MKMSPAQRIVVFQNVMGSVAVDAYGDAFILLLYQPAAMSADPIAGELVRAQPVRVHAFNIGMTVSTKVRYILTTDAASKVWSMIKIGP